MDDLNGRVRGQRMLSSKATPFPSRQLFILALCRICEPIAFMSIFPYIYFMVKSFNITDDKRQIALYAGMVTSAFAFAEFSASVFWGRFSDRVGRKPILLTGMAGTGISMLAFGFAPTLPWALVARAMGGLLNGNIGVLTTTVAEVVTVKAHQPRAFSIMPSVWCLGSIVGAGLGGTLAEPAKNYPSYFSQDGLFAQFPYLLPNIVCAIVVVFGLIIGFLFLEETHEDKKERKDVGLEIGHWILRNLTCRLKKVPTSKVGYFEETLSYIAEDEKLSCAATLLSTASSPNSSTASSPLLAPASCSNPALQAFKVPKPSPISLRQSFTRQVTLIIVSYGILAFHTIALEQLMPILFASEESTTPVHLPFKFVGGFHLSSKTIGFILSGQGFLQMLAQLFLFPAVNRRLGSLWTFRIVIIGYPLLYFFIPYLALVRKEFRPIAIFMVLVWKVIGQTLSYPSSAIMLTNSAPSKKVLGTLNGFAASAASLARAFGPSLAGLIHAAGLNLGYSGFSWWSCALVATIGACVSLLMTEKPCRTTSLLSHDSCDESESLVEPLLDSRLSDDTESGLLASGSQRSSFDAASPWTMDENGCR